MMRAPMHTALFYAWIIPNRHTFRNGLAPTKRNLYGVFPKNQLFADLNRTQPVAKGVQLRRQLAAEATGDLAAMRDVLGKLVRAADRVLVRGMRYGQLQRHAALEAVNVKLVVDLRRTDDAQLRPNSI